MIPRPPPCRTPRYCRDREFLETRRKLLHRALRLLCVKCGEKYRDTYIRRGRSLRVARLAQIIRREDPELYEHLRVYFSSHRNGGDAGVGKSLFSAIMGRARAAGAAALITDSRTLGDLCNALQKIYPEILSTPAAAEEA